MNHEDIQFMEHMAIKSMLSLDAFCEVAQKALGLPKFEYDAENETEWGIAVKDGVEYNISRPYKAETLRTWDPTVPHGCNFGLILIFPKDLATTIQASAALVEHVGRTLPRLLALPFPITVHGWGLSTTWRETRPSFRCSDA
jgi:hypothetical protein